MLERRSSSIPALDTRDEKRLLGRVFPFPSLGSCRVLGLNLAWIFDLVWYTLDSSSNPGCFWDSPDESFPAWKRFARLGRLGL